MAYTRSLVSRDVWGDWDLPSGRLIDQHFGMGLNDVDFMPTSSYYSGRYPLVRRSLVPAPRTVLRQLSSGGLSEIRTDSDKFQVLLDVSHFAPEEITVKTVDDQVVVVGNHEEKVDEHGYVSRQFTRRYMLPQGVEPEAVKSTLSADGILTVEAPRKKPQQALAANERPVPISVVGGVAEPVATAKEIPVQKEQSK